MFADTRENVDERYATLAGNLFPSSTYNYYPTDDTPPYGGFSAGNLIHKPLRNITENEDGSGMYVSRCHADQLNRLSLRRGIYVIRYANGETRRILAR